MFFLALHFFKAQDIADLKKNIHDFLKDKQAEVGVSIVGYNGSDSLFVRGNEARVMQSVFKFPIAITALHWVDKNKIKLHQKIKIDKKDLIPNTYSPIRDQFPNGVQLTFAQLIYYAVAESDNIATDIILEKIGGPSIVENYMKKCGISDISVKMNEVQMHENWNHQFQNWITPKASYQLLKLFYENKNQLLTQKSHRFLWKTMKATTTGAQSIRGFLPAQTIIAHKTGSSGTNKEGVTAALNDIGIVFLPNGKYFYLSVFVGNSKENAETNQKIIAQIALYAWNYFDGLYSKKY